MGENGVYGEAERRANPETGRKGYALSWPEWIKVRQVR